MNSINKIKQQLKSLIYKHQKLKIKMESARFSRLHFSSLKEMKQKLVSFKSHTPKSFLYALSYLFQHYSHQKTYTAKMPISDWQ